MLTFLDPKCWTDCPLLAAQVAQVARDTTGAKVDVVAVAANTYHHRDRDLRHFIATYGLRDTPRFHFLNGTTAQLQAVWSSYGIEVAMKPTDKMAIHSDSVFVIAPNGRLRAVIPDDPGSGGAQTASSVTALEQALRDCGVRW